MHSTTLPFTLPTTDTTYLLDLDRLMQHFQTLVDQRSARGIRYPLAILLMIAVLAKLAGATQLEALADWAKLRAPELVAFFQLKHATMPHKTTWSRVLQHALDLAALDQVTTACVAPCPTGEVPDRASIAVNLDGKTLRGTIPRGATRGVHLLAAFCPDYGVVLLQVAVAGHCNEITAAPMLLQQLDLTGTLVSGDALLTQRALSIQIVEAGGDYLWRVKENQPTLLAEIALLFDDECVRAGWSAPPVDFRTAERVEGAHGRIEQQRLRVSSMLADYSEWPYLAQVFQVETLRIDKLTGEVSRMVRYGVTSAPAEVLGAARLLERVRGHWGIETWHGRRDGCLGEDASRVRTGQAPQVLATLNNLVLGIFARLGIRQTTAAQRGVAYGIDRLLHSMHHAGGTLQ